RAADLRMLAEGKPQQLIERIPGSPFDTRHLLVVKFPFASETGERFIGGTAIDITEREAALRALGTSEPRYRRVLEQNTVPGRHACLMIVRDLTALESTLDQLRISEQRWQLALHGAGDALWDWDLTTNRIFRSPRWRGMLGYEDWEIGDAQADFISLLHPDDV